MRIWRSKRSAHTSEDDGPLDAPARERVWAQDVAVNVEVLRARLNRVKVSAAGERPGEQALIAGVERLLERAEKAAYRDDPKPTRLGNWWRGTLIEAAYQNLHAAEAAIVMLYDEDEVDAEVPEAVARVQMGLNRDDPRRRAVRHLAELKGKCQRLALRKAIEVGYAAADRQHTRVRNFRNILLVTALLIALIVSSFTVVAAVFPQAFPLCFELPTETPDAVGMACPAGGSTPSPLDAVVVVLLGLLGGALAAAVSVRTMRGTSTPYDVPIALAVLKVPAGALTAIGGLVAIRGQFVPGFSALDSQEQILAYALVLGYAQQLLTRLIDHRADEILDSVPSKDATVSRTPLDEWPDPEIPRPRDPDEAPGGRGGPAPEERSGATGAGR